MPIILLKYLPQIIGGIVILGVLTWAYNKIYDRGYESAKHKYELQIAEMKKEAEDIFKKREEELTAHIEQGKQRYETAESKYAKAMLDIANAPKSSSLPIRTKNCSSVSTLPRHEGQSNKGENGNVGQSVEARLPERNTELLNRAMNDIKQLQAECQYVRDTVEFEVK